jgi:hypothetical protein
MSRYILFKVYIRIKLLRSNYRKILSFIFSFMKVEKKLNRC